MPRALPLPRLVKKAVACEHLGCCRETFWRRWDGVFTDGRTADEKRAAGPGRGSAERLVFEDELRAAVENGGGERGRQAVLALRARLGRLTDH